MMQLICYPKCSTCKNAEKWLKDREIEYDYRHIKEQNPTVEELTKWINESGLPISRFFNTSGMLYRELNVKDKLKTLPQAELIKLLASDGMLVKRPILLKDNEFLLSGFKEKEWAEKLKF